MSSTKTPREPKTYRAARRNARRGEPWRGVRPTHRVFHAAPRPNRARRLPPATITVSVAS